MLSVVMEYIINSATFMKVCVESLIRTWVDGEKGWTLSQGQWASCNKTLECMGYYPYQMEYLIGKLSDDLLNNR